MYRLQCGATSPPTLLGLGHGMGKPVSCVYTHPTHGNPYPWPTWVRHVWGYEREAQSEHWQYGNMEANTTQWNQKVWANFKIFNFILALSTFHTLVRCGRWPNYYFNYYFAKKGRQNIFHILLRHKYKSEEEKKKSHQWQLELQCLGNCARKVQDHPFEIRSV